MFFKPMNAATLAPDKVDQFLQDGNYIMEQKLDGYRAVWDGEKLYSRLGNEFHLPQITSFLPHNALLDGELYIPGGTSSDVTTALGKDGDKDELTYVLYDCLGIDGDEYFGENFHVRRSMLEDVFNESLFDVENIGMTVVHRDKMGIMDYTSAMEYINSHNIEGFMLKNLDAPYQCGKRPVKTFLKLKRHDTADVVITGFTEGKGKYYGFIGSVEFGLYKGNSIVNVGSCSGMDNATRISMSVYPERYVGKVMEIGYMQLTENCFRHPAMKCIRDDKAAIDCKWEQYFKL